MSTIPIFISVLLIFVCKIFDLSLASMNDSKSTEYIKFFRHILEGRPFVVKTDHRPLVHAFAQKLEKASPRQLNQLSFISEFTTEIVYVKGEENVVADALSRVNVINMPTALDLQTIYDAQQADRELQEILRDGRSLRLQLLNYQGHQIHCDTSTGWIRPYLPEPLRKQAFDIIHSPAHPSGRSTARH